MFQELPTALNWLAPWEPLKDSGEVFVNELHKELASGHVLFHVSVHAIARHVGCDDVLFVTADPANPLAVVHLTWASRTEADPQWPYTTLYKNWQEWIEHRMNPDHQEYLAASQEKGGRQ
jgi:hypothetical protein